MKHSIKLRIVRCDATIVQQRTTVVATPVDPKLRIGDGPESSLLQG